MKTATFALIIAVATALPQAPTPIANGTSGLQFWPLDSQRCTTKAEAEAQGYFPIPSTNPLKDLATQCTHRPGELDGKATAALGMFDAQEAFSGTYKGEAFNVNVESEIFSANEKRIVCAPDDQAPANAPRQYILFVQNLGKKPQGMDRATASQYWDGILDGCKGEGEGYGGYNSPYGNNVGVERDVPPRTWFLK